VIDLKDSVAKPYHLDTSRAVWLVLSPKAELPCYDRLATDHRAVVRAGLAIKP
jgi:hypothetical protein